MKALNSTGPRACLVVFGTCFMLLSISVVPVTVWAQTGPALDEQVLDNEGDALDEDGYPIDEVVSVGTRQGFTLVSDIIPDVSFNAGDISALGVTNIGQLITAINAETGNDSSEPPIILLNGRPVANLREIRSFPSEAIRKVDVLPPEAALKFSSNPNRRVLNFSLRRRFNAITANLDGKTTTEGGRDMATAGGNYLKIHNKTRISLTAKFESAESLSEAERDIIDRNADRFFALGGNILAPNQSDEIDPDFSTLAGDIVTIIGAPPVIRASPTLDDFLPGANNANITDQRFFRDLEPETENISLNGSLFRPVGERLSINGSLNADFSTSESSRGLVNTTVAIAADNPFSPFSNDVTLLRYDDALIRKREKSDIETNLTLFGDYPLWRWSIEGQYAKITDKRDTNRGLDFAPTQSRITQNDPTLNPFGFLSLTALSKSNRAEEALRLKGRVNGQVTTLPAGPVKGSVKLEYSDTALEAFSQFNTEQSQTAFSRTVGLISAEIGIPLTDTRNGSNRRSTGKSTLRLSGGLESVEDFGTLSSYGAGLRWNATDKLSLQGSLDYSERAPSLSQIGNPVLIDPNVRVTDFEVNDRVLIDRITGGNADLSPESRRDIQVTARYRHSRDLTLSTRYRARESEDAIESFPFLTPQVARAFPDRLLRDNGGQLIGIDARPVNATRAQRDTLRTGLNWSKRFISPSAADRSARPETQSNQSSERRSRGGRQGRTRPNQIGVSLYHTWRLKDEFQFRDDGPVFDLLGGAALRRQGGTSEHEIEARFSFRRKNIGGSFSLDHESGSQINSEFLSANQSAGGGLTFDPLITGDFRLYYDLGRNRNGRRVNRDDWRSGLRVTLDIDNLTDEKQSVSNAQAIVPFGYEQDALDPQGRTVMLSLRKLYAISARR